ncbi:LolA-like putative outer membrane lipoprotein chaperone [uncultured Bacteroides sp.]|uniref:LolA-like putative outer membrane lipoprotein chaperone n=1 Tax=uncultured Bacteroides sp. TaxID=162156 RepID=UPI002636C17B|nr:LolA-like putative outer membrane lipoprotein chaperone [uncultured Bacteroides sp.]
MRHKILLLLMIILPVQAFTQKDVRAREVLEGMTAVYKKAEGTEILFGGTMEGTLALKGEMFVLDCAGIKSWFDGKTLWSYVKDSGEVNVSTPTPEEVQAINPYKMLGMYRNGFDYKYTGTKNRNGRICKEVILTPETEQDIKSITVGVDTRMEPVYIDIDSNGETQRIEIKKYTVRKLGDEFFRFNPKDYPGLEVIDLR